MSNIEQYRKRFYNLMESTMGDVKPLINEDDRGTVLDLASFKGKIKAILVSTIGEDDFPDIPIDIESNPPTLNLQIKKYSWDENEEFSVIIKFPEEFRNRISQISDTSKAKVSLLKDNRKIGIESKIELNPERNAPQSLFINDINVQGLDGGPLTINIRFAQGSVVNKDTSNNPITKNFVSILKVYPITNGNLDVSKMYQVETKTVTYSPKSGMLSIPLTNSKSGEENYLHYKCGQDLEGESGKVKVTLNNGDTVAIDEKNMNTVKQMFCPAPLTSSK
jgi:hypothetical protein